MNKIPLKICPECGRYNDFTVSECECGRSLDSVRARPMDISLVLDDKRGVIGTFGEVYEQKCPVCSMITYLVNPEDKATKCFNCSRGRISRVNPVLYVEEAEEEKSGATEALPDEPLSEEEADSYSEHIRDTLDSLIEKSGGDVAEPDYDDDDDDDEEANPWASLLGGAAAEAPKPKRQEAKAKDSGKISFMATRGMLSFSVSQSQGEYMLGRSANQSEFLSKDNRVSNRHCVIFFRNGSWFVRDNRSANGTAVNSCDIGDGGECRLRDGDELKLGHNSDSPVFRISIK
ncbi:MAG: FHA domain-containing protein [Oscillospiraceae bacterium]|nr:FHA domain-containing protein [Oscillospiraceae bacterium]